MPDTPSSARGAIALAIGLVISAAILGGAITTIRGGNDELVVTGSARRAIRSDYAIWKGAVSSQQPSLAAAYAELKRYSDRARGFLKAKGIADSLVTVEGVVTEQIQEYVNGQETGRIQGYRLRQAVRVRSRDVEGLTAISQQVGDLVNEGVPFVAEPIEYLYTKLPDLRKEMLGEATKDARERAEAIASAAGASVGAVRSVRMGVFQVTPRFSTEVSDYGVNDTQSLDKDITSVVRVTFAVR